MTQVVIKINGRDYRIACKDGQEEHLSGLARYLDGKVDELVDDVGQIGDTSLMLMAGLLVTDELSDTREELDAARDGAARDARDARTAIRETEERLAERIDALSQRIEAVASLLSAE